MADDENVRRFDSMADALTADAIKAPDVVVEGRYHCDACGESWEFPTDAPRGCFRMSITRRCPCGTVYEVTQSRPEQG